MNRALVAVALAGLTGCQLIIGDIELPDDDGRDLAALEGTWRLYGLADGAALDARLVFDDAGGVGYGEGAVEPRKLRRDPETTTRYRATFGDGLGELVGRFDAASGLGLFTASAGAPVFAIVIREPAAGARLPGGWSATAGITGAGLLVGGVSLLAPGTSGYDETRYPLDGSGPIARRVAVDEDPSDPTRRGLVPLDGMGGGRWLTPSPGGDFAIGVQRIGAQGAAVVVWEPGDALPSTTVVCSGIGQFGGETATRVLAARFGETVRWEDGREGRAIAAGGGYRLAPGYGFFEGIGTLVLPDADGRVFAVLPVEPGPDPHVALTAAWGFGLCLRGEAAAVVDAGVGDAAVDGGGAADAGWQGDGGLDGGPGGG